MARYEFRLPDICEGIAEAEIVAWHVKPGDRVEEDGKIADVMTDKATVEMESPVSGVVLEVAGAEGDMIAIGSTLVVIETEGEGEEEPPAAEAIAERIEVETPDAGDVARVVAAQAQQAVEAKPIEAPRSEEKVSLAESHAKVLASPAVRARAAGLGIDLANVKPAEDGRIRHADLDAFLSYNGAYRAAGGKRGDEGPFSAHGRICFGIVDRRQ